MTTVVMNKIGLTSQALSPRHRSTAQGDLGRSILEPVKTYESSGWEHWSGFEQRAIMKP